MDIFDHLRYWMSLGENEVKLEFTSESKKIVLELLEVLADQSSQKISVDADNFPQVVAELHELMVLGSNEFGRALLQAEDLLATGNIHEAIAELKDFRDWTPSKFYKDMAANHILRIEKRTRIGSTR